MQTLTVGAKVNLIRQFGDVDVEAVLHVIQDLCVVLVRDEGDGESFGTETASTGDSMQVGVGVFGHVVVEHDVHTFNVHAATEEIRGDEDALK